MKFSLKHLRRIWEMFNLQRILYIKWWAYNSNYILATTQLWNYQKCKIGEYFSDSSSSWSSWGISWKGKWAYQSHWFSSWPGEFIDLDTMQWVPQCDTSTQIQINDTRMHNVPLWRSLTYYLNPLSTSLVELGTLKHPYKHFSSILVELVHFHSNEDNRNIKIMVMEKSISYWLISETYISNITSVSISTYSEVNITPEKANIEGIDKIDKKVDAGYPTLFSILSNYSTS